MEHSMKVKNGARYLGFIYAVVLAVMLCLMWQSETDYISLGINVVMFVIIAIVFVFAGKKFKSIQEMTSEFYTASIIIEEDSKKHRSYLWDKYKNGSADELFFEDDLSNLYNKYLDEMKRLDSLSGGSYKCAIDHYINKDFLDITASKNLLNLIPGVMTGLGILGTFVGLALGLQEFNTGTASEIASSIAPLMSGIKVAFHTSIVGMICSLAFNWLYKQVFEDAYTALEEFLDNYDLYVTGDVEGNNASSTQNILNNIPDAISEKIGEKLAQVLEPALERMNITMESFADRVSENQLEGVSKIVDHFVNEMNHSLGDGFKELGEIIDQTCELQKKNGEFIRNLLLDIEKMADNTKTIHDMPAKTIQEFSVYIEKIENLQEKINQSFESVILQMNEQQQIQKGQQEYIKTLVKCEEEVSTAFEKLLSSTAEQQQTVSQMEKAVSESAKNNMTLITEKASESNALIAQTTERQIDGISQMSKVISENMDKASEKFDTSAQEFYEHLAGSLNETFEIFDKNLAEITRHLSGTIAEVETTTERVPKVVLAAYDGMEKSFGEMEKTLEKFSQSLDMMCQEFVELHKTTENKELLIETKEGEDHE